MAIKAGFGGIGANAVRRAATRLKYPQLLLVTAALFGLDLLVPDLVPFVDEILLGLGTALLASWRERVEVPGGPGAAPASDKPPEKNVTPPR
jgi:hypothetical protein